MSVHFHFEQVKFRIRSVRKLKSWIEEVIIKERHTPGDLNYIFCDDAYLVQLNQKYLAHDEYTDIITFDYVDDLLVSGDIYISFDRIRSNAKKFGSTVTDELHRVMIHGVLHLLGYSDKHEEHKLQMRSKEDFYLSLRAL